MPPHILPLGALPPLGDMSPRYNNPINFGHAPVAHKRGRAGGNPYVKEGASHLPTPRSAAGHAHMLPGIAPRYAPTAESRAVTPGSSIMDYVRHQGPTGRHGARPTNSSTSWITTHVEGPDTPRGGD
eukprot:CAMPEP_0182912392 /NCGR_PEP_ID=MMETSP0034_2-20130328/37490_1 /TAXON_ID=156128 /ORGANISM="Nephroselmis pyriformis, Strain CCMP717" /LENGTH=126 /DNA_ID=CAMNT_0025049063 /DNA_START=182 /DNA_END=559 /DNA_ORIENTATION=+